MRNSPRITTCLRLRRAISLPALLLALLAPGQASAGGYEWSWIKPPSAVNQPGAYGTLGVPAPANAPGGRFGQSFCSDAAGRLWVFGGYGWPAASEAYLNDLWQFNPATGNWTWMKGSNGPNQSGLYGPLGQTSPNIYPGARWGSTLLYDSAGALWLFGGRAGSTRFNDLWKYTVSTGNWTYVAGSDTGNQSGVYGALGVPAPANRPGGRYVSAGWIDAAGDLWFFGGDGYDSLGIGTGFLGDLWRFNPATGNWTWMKGPNTTDHAGVYNTQGTSDPSSNPGGRSSAAVWNDPATGIWIFGGVGRGSTASLGLLNDLWSYNAASNRWTWIKGSNAVNQSGGFGAMDAPAPSNNPVSMFDPAAWTDGAGSLLLYGGTNGTALSALWRFDPPSSNWTWIGGPQSSNEPPVFGTQGIHAPANTPGARVYPAAFAGPNGLLWLFGGSYKGDPDDNSAVASDLWLLTPLSNAADTARWMRYR